MTSEERKECEELAARIAVINKQVMGMVPDFLNAVGSRVDAKAWQERLQPLIDEHHQIVTRLKKLASR
jgi:hypothetical protein